MRTSTCFGLLALFVFFQSAAAREWVDSTGKHKTIAEFVQVDGDAVVLKNSEGKTVHVPLDRLSQQDQQHVRQLTSGDVAATQEAPGAAEPAAPVELPKGKLFGADFQSAVVKLQGVQLSFASDDGFFPDQSVQLFLFSGDEKLAGKKFEVGPNSRGMSPHVHLRTKQPLKTGMVMGGYTMQLTFGPQQGKTLRGHIDLNIPKHQTTLSGTFVVEEPKNYKLPPTEEEAPYIVVTVRRPRSATEDDLVKVGYVGAPAAGKSISNMAGTDWSDSGWASSLTFEPRVTSILMNDRGLVGQHVNLEPGTYFHFFVWKDGYLVGELVDLEADSQIKSQLKFDPSDAGSLEVASSGEDDIMLVPQELADRAEQMKTSLMGLAFQLGISREPEGGRATFEALRPGKYVAVAGDSQQTVEILPGKKVTLIIERTQPERSTARAERPRAARRSPAPDQEPAEQPADDAQPDVDPTRLSVEGAVLFAGQPIDQFTGQRPTFRFRDEESRELVKPGNVEYEDGAYRIYGLAPGEYRLSVFLDANEDNPPLHPGDFRKFTRIEVQEEEPTQFDVHLSKLMRLRKPQDNNEVMEGWDERCDKIAWKSPVLIEWDSLGEGASYAYAVRRWQCSPFRPLEGPEMKQTTETKVELDLSASEPGEFYQFTLNGYLDGKSAGILITRGDRGFGYDYRFRVQTAEE